MGCCCSCWGGGGEEENGSASSAAETELQAQNAEGDRKMLSIARGMSAPTIEVEDRTKVSGHGLALAAVVIEQDTAYWEVHVAQAKEGSVDAAMFGLATKKDRKFYAALEENEDHNSSPETHGTDLMSKIEVANGDVVGVMVQQSDLPMVQFLLNGEVQHDRSINRFRGAVYPSVFLPSESAELSLRLVFNEKEFKQSPPSSRFCPVMVARGLV